MTEYVPCHLEEETKLQPLLSSKNILDRK